MHNDLNRVAVILFMAMAVLTYGRCLNNTFMLDDVKFIEGRSRSGFHEAHDFFIKNESRHYSPLYFAGNFLLFRLFEARPWAFHLINILLLYFSALLFYRISFRLTHSGLTALIAGVLMLVHPMHHFAVCAKTFNFVFYCAIFMELSFLSFWQSLGTQARQKLNFVISLIFFILALLSHEWAVLLPVFIGGALFFFGNRPVREIPRRLWPYLAIDILFVGLYLVMASSELALPERIASLNIGFFDFTASWGFLVFWYVSNLIFPRNIVLMAHTGVVPQPAVFWNALLFVTVAASVRVMVCRWKKSAKSFALLWFLTGFILAVPAAFAHSDMGLVLEPHWFYFFSFGFFLLAALIFVELSARMGKRLFRALMIVVVLSYFAATQYFITQTQSEKQYCRYWLRFFPGNTIARTTLGNIYFEEGKFGQALELYRAVIRSGEADRYKEYTNIGLIYSVLNQGDEAKKNLNRALELNPSYTPAYNALGNMARQEGDRARAKHYYKQAVTFEPFMAEPRLNLANLFIEEEKWPEAQRVLSGIDPSQVKRELRRDFYGKLIALAFKTGDSEKGFRIMQQLFSTFGDAGTYVYLSQSLAQLNMGGLALNVLDAALRQFPNQPDIYLLYGVILGNSGRVDEAVSWWEKGKEIAPRDMRFDQHIQKAKIIRASDSS